MSFYKRVVLKRILYTISTVLIICFIFLQSSKSADVSAGESGRVLALLNKLALIIGLVDPFSHEFVRTCAHFTEFFALGISLFFMYRAYYQKLLFNAVVSTASAFFIAFCDECIQLFAEGRTFQIEDLIVDTSGAVTAVIITMLLLTIRNIILKKNQRG